MCVKGGGGGRMEMTCIHPITQRDGPLHGMCMDPVKGSVFTYQKFKTWLYTPHMETR